MIKDANYDLHLNMLLKSLGKNKRIKYGDIDVWLVDGAKSTTRYALLDVMRLSNKDDIIDITTTQDTREMLISCIKKSKFATTFLVASESEKETIQVMRNKVTSVENLINEFDLNICKVAWNNNILYVHQSAVDDFSNLKLSFSENFNSRLDGHPGSLAYNCIRYLKYQSRYNLEPTKAVCDYMVGSLTKCIDHLEVSKTIDEPLSILVPSITNLTALTPATIKFGTAEPTTDTHYLDKRNLNAFVRSFTAHDRVLKLLDLENIDKSFILFLLNNDNYKNVLQLFLDRKNVNCFIDKKPLNFSSSLVEETFESLPFKRFKIKK